MIANLAFWIFFWISLTIRMVPYEPHPPLFEEMRPAFVIDSRAFPALEERTALSLKLVRYGQLPSILMVYPAGWLFNEFVVEEPPLGADTYWGMSPAIYHLILITLVSFGQWYLVALFVMWLIQKFKRA